MAFPPYFVGAGRAPLTFAFGERDVGPQRNGPAFLSEIEAGNWRKRLHMMSFGKTRIVAMLATLAVAFTLVSTDFADARRGGSFGSRGLKTFQSAPPTRTAPNPTGPVERSMTPNTGPTAATRQPGVTQQRPGFLNGLGGSLVDPFDGV